MLTALTLSTWVGYGITSRERWASRAFAVEIMNAFEDTYDIKPWPRVGDGGGGCPSPAGDASVRARSTIPRPDLTEIDATALAQEFASFEASITELEEAGYDVERALRATSNSSVVVPISAAFLVTRDDDAAQVAPTSDFLGINAATTDCNSRTPISLFRQVQFGTIDELTVEAVCAIEHEDPVFPGACGDQ